MTYISGKSITAIGAIFPILGMLTLGLRYYVRITKRQRLGPDDWLSVTALVSYCVAKTGLKSFDCQLDLHYWCRRGTDPWYVSEMAITTMNSTTNCSSHRFGEKRVRESCQSGHSHKCSCIQNSYHRASKGDSLQR